MQDEKASTVEGVEIEALSDEDLETVAGGVTGDSTGSSSCCSNFAASCAGSCLGCHAD